MKLQSASKRDRCSLEPNDRLSELLQAWRDIEPGADFEGKVWDRIRLKRNESLIPFPTKTVKPFKNYLRLAAAAAVIGLITGALTGLVTTSAPQTEGFAENVDSRMFYARSLTDSYNSLVRILPDQDRKE